MKKIELVYREILYRVIEKKLFSFTQSELSRKLDISLSIINLAVKKLRDMGSVKVSLRSFSIIDFKKILYYWASIRNLSKDIIFSARLEMPVREIERCMPNGVIYTAYSAYKFAFKDVPADYSEVYVYANEKELEIVEKRITTHQKFLSGIKKPNFFILKKDDLIEIYPSLPLAQIFVDLWNLSEWYAKDFIREFEERFNKIIGGAF